MKNFRHIPDPAKVLHKATDEMIGRCRALRTFIDEFIVDLAQEVAIQDKITAAGRKTERNGKRTTQQLQIFIVADSNTCLNSVVGGIIYGDSDQSQSPDR